MPENKDFKYYTAEQVFERLHQFVKTNDVGQINAPVAIKVFATGQIVVTYSLSSSPILCSSFGDAINHIRQWLEENDKHCILCQKGIEHSNCTFN